MGVFSVKVIDKRTGRVIEEYNYVFFVGSKSNLRYYIVNELKLKGIDERDVEIVIREVRRTSRTELFRLISEREGDKLTEDNLTYLVEKYWSVAKNVYSSKSVFKRALKMCIKNRKKL